MRVSFRTDVWSMGCLLFAWWFGYSPFECEFSSSSHSSSSSSSSSNAGAGGGYDSSSISDLPKVIGSGAPLAASSSSSSSSSSTTSYGSSSAAAQVRVVECSPLRVLADMPRPLRPSREDALVLQAVQWVLVKDFSVRPFATDVIEHTQALMAAHTTTHAAGSRAENSSFSLGTSLSSSTMHEFPV
jgi:hypothetical protein